MSFRLVPVSPFSLPKCPRIQPKTTVNRLNWALSSAAAWMDLSMAFVFTKQQTTTESILGNYIMPWEITWPAQHLLQSRQLVGRLFILVALSPLQLIQLMLPLISVLTEHTQEQLTILLQRL